MNARVKTLTNYFHFMEGESFLQYLFLLLERKGVLNVDYVVISFASKHSERRSWKHPSPVRIPGMLLAISEFIVRLF